MENRSASSEVASELLYRDAPETIRMALFTKRAKVKRERASSTIEYLRQARIAEMEGRYLAVSSSPGKLGGEKFPCEMSKWRRRACTTPLPRKMEWGITVAPRMPQLR